MLGQLSLKIFLYFHWSRGSRWQFHTSTFRLQTCGVRRDESHLSYPHQVDYDLENCVTSSTTPFWEEREEETAEEKLEIWQQVQVPPFMLELACAWLSPFCTFFIRLMGKRGNVLRWSKLINEIKESFLPIQLLQNKKIHLLGGLAPHQGSSGVCPASISQQIFLLLLPLLTNSEKSREGLDLQEISCLRLPAQAVPGEDVTGLCFARAVAGQGWATASLVGYRLHTSFG